MSALHLLRETDTLSGLLADDPCPLIEGDEPCEERIEDIDAELLSGIRRCQELARVRLSCEARMRRMA